ncbi:hypothetical protein RintRC_3540 [Richelia intracellularis]|nr:hypothetical protein RintRC_3540 [Richelia intracellularis]
MPCEIFYHTSYLLKHPLISLGATLSALTKRQYKMLLVVTEVYRQQLWLYENKKQSISDRIVSLNQPHIRPILRG